MNILWYVNVMYEISLHYFFAAEEEKERAAR